MVDDVDAAIDHIDRFGSAHTEAIVTKDLAAARRFTAGSIPRRSWSTPHPLHRGVEFGLGAEIGISTESSTPGPRWPLPELTTTKWVVEGDGQIRV